MRFLIQLQTSHPKPEISLNYPYYLSAAIYRIIAKGDAEYAQFLHEQGYGKKFKFFSFSQLNTPFKIDGDRMKLISSQANFQVSFHLPQAAENFVKGLFQSEQIEIADKISKVAFKVTSVESLPDPLKTYKENEIVSVLLKPLSPIVVGLPNEKGNYDFLEPSDVRFAESLVYNWRNKIAACYDQATADSALLMAEVIPMNKPFKSRLTTIKSGTKEETKVRGWLYLLLKVTTEKRFVEILLNGGVGIYNSVIGGGCVEVIK